MPHGVLTLSLHSGGAEPLLPAWSHLPSSLLFSVSPICGWGFKMGTRSRDFPTPQLSTILPCPEDRFEPFERKWVLPAAEPVSRCQLFKTPSSLVRGRFALSKLILRLFFSPPLLRKHAGWGYPLSPEHPHPPAMSGSSLGALLEGSGCLDPARAAGRLRAGCTVRSLHLVPGGASVQRCIPAWVHPHPRDGGA